MSSSRPMNVIVPTILLLMAWASTASAQLPAFLDEPFPVALDPARIHLADMDNDGDDDLVTLGAAGLEVWRNDGWPNFTSITSEPTSSGSRWSIADWDKDGSLDVLVGGEPAILFVNDGSGVLTPGNTFNVANGDNVALGGFGNGDLDVAITTSGTGTTDLYVFPDGDPANTPSPWDQIGVFDAENTPELIAADYNNDGWDDLFIATNLGGFIVLPNDSGAGWFPEVQHVSNAFNSAATAGAFDGLPGTDALFAGGGGVNEVWQYDAMNGYTLIHTTPEFIFDLGTMDSNADGGVDIVISQCCAPAMVEYLTIREYGGGDEINLPLAQATFFGVGDIDNDTDPDVVVKTTGGLVAVRNQLVPNVILETCDGIDNDLNGLVDDPAFELSPCAAGEECHWGSCFRVCATSGECPMGNTACWLDDGRCDDDTDPCATVAPTCTANGQTCYGGSCFTGCSSDAECDPTDERCYKSATCRDKDDPCKDVQCLDDQICIQGGCFYSCTVDDDCTMYNPGHFCFDGRCAATACESIDCPWDKDCIGGSCFTTCGDDDECDPDTERCYNAERCATSPCDGIQCPSEQECFGGVCFVREDCPSDSASCPTGDVCYGDTCLPEVNLCGDVQCGTTQQCYGGTCLDECTDDAECDPDSICFKGLCQPADDPYCGAVNCPNGQGCYRGECFDGGCIDDSECADDESCLGTGACVKKDCTETPMCEDDETCKEGVGACLPGCMVDSDCDGDGESCYEGICGTSPCAAYAFNDIADYHDNHLFTALGQRLNSTQYTTPWLWPRPFNTAQDLSTWAAGALGTVSAESAARVVFHYDSANDRYGILLTQGATTAGQGAGEGTYSIRVYDWQDNEPDIVFNPNNEAKYQTKNGDDDVHIQTTLTNPDAQSTSVGIGYLDSDRNWEVQILASFNGDITSWEMYNAETGDTYFLNPGEPLYLSNPKFPKDSDPDEKIYVDSGTPCDGAGLPGQCDDGSQFICRQGAMLCDMTVTPWDFEVCDGIDNDCDGEADEAADLRYPIVESRQVAVEGWKFWPTFDRAEDISTSMNYVTRGSNDQQGRVDFLDENGMSVLANKWSTTVAHRDTNTGKISVPTIHSKWVSSSDVANDIGTRNRGMLMWSPLDHNFDEFFVSWYDDRAPGGGGNDKVVEDFDSPDEFRITQRMEQYVEVGNNLEPDAFVIEPLWFEAATGGDSRVNIQYLGDNLDWELGDGELYGEDSDGDDDDQWVGWRKVLPQAGNVSIDRQYPVRIRIKGKPVEEAFCISDTPTAEGCRLARYTCSSGQTICPMGDNDLCDGGACVDSDEDGYDAFDESLCPMGNDCNDNDPAINPGATELCDGIDQDCDDIPDVQTQGCPDGAASCGPGECGFLPVCSCPAGPEDPSDPPDLPCICMESLSYE